MVLWYGLVVMALWYGLAVWPCSRGLVVRGLAVTRYKGVIQGTRYKGELIQGTKGYTERQAGRSQRDRSPYKPRRASGHAEP